MTQRPRLALLDTSFDDPNTPRNFRRELAADLAEFQVTSGHLPESHEYDGLVVTGSAASVYDPDEQWVEGLLAYVREAHERGLPILGVCFGHQAVATALGGEVEDMGEYELGYREIRRVEGAENPLLEGVPEQFTAFTTHSDTVTALPDGAELLARNDFGVQAYRLGTTYGVQFHPEYDRETARAVTAEKDLPADRIEAVLAGITPEAFAAAARTKRLFENFLAVVARQGADADPAASADPDAA